MIDKIYSDVKYVLKKRATTNANIQKKGDAIIRRPNIDKRRNAKKCKEKDKPKTVEEKMGLSVLMIIGTII